jgi:ubiquinone/menaquinone biosynthesis C-methylase UbiE
VSIPREYYDIAEFLNQQDEEEFRILSLPLTTHWAGYTPYKWGYVGPDILYTLTDKPLIDKFANPIAPTEYLELVEKLEGATPRELLQYCQILNVKYILLRNDVDLEHPYQKVYNSPEYYRDALESSDAIKDKHVFGNLVLYELKSYTPRVLLVSANVSGNSFSEKFLHSTYQSESINYLHFVDNPMTLEISKKEPIESFNMEITFALEPKNVTEGDWQVNNHALIQTDLFKVAISPRGWLYVFMYLKNGSVWDLTIPFDGKGSSNMNLDFKNYSLSVHLNEVKIGEANLKLADRLSFIKIESNVVGAERLVGKVYDLNFSVNGESLVSTQKLFSSHPDYVESEIHRKLHLTYEKVEWKKISSTKYIVTLNNASAEDAREFFLVFLTTYDPQWKAYYVENGVSEAVSEDNHIHAFDYGNAWYLDKAGNFTIVLEYTPQRLYDAGLKIPFLMFGLLLSIIIIPESKMLKLKKFTSKVKELIISFKETKVDRQKVNRKVETYGQLWNERVKRHGAVREALSTSSQESLTHQFRLWLKLSGNPDDKTILYAGCGYGRLMKKFSKYTEKVFGIDISGEMLKEAKKYLGDGSKLHKGSITNLPFKDHLFDIVVCDRVLMHLTELDMKTALLEFKRVLKPGGIILFSVPHRLSWLYSVRSFIFSVYTILLKASGRLKIIHPRGFDEVKLRKILEEVGLTNYKISSMRYNLGILLLVRVVVPEVLNF